MTEVFIHEKKLSSTGRTHPPGLQFRFSNLTDTETMRKITFTLAVLLITSFQAAAQTNLITNLTWESQYDFGNYHFLLQWDEPNLPHDEIIGYNIYRDAELYRFQTERYLASFGINPNCGQDFMAYESDGDGFVIHVTAVYSGGMESGYGETALAENNLLRIAGFNNQSLTLYPNPTNGIVNIPNENVTKVLVYDASGKQLKELKSQPRLNLSDLPKGIYVLKLFSGQEIQNYKVILK